MAFILRKSEHFPSYHTVSVFSVTLHFLFALLFSNFSSAFVNFSRIRSVGRAVDCRAEGRGFDSRNRINTQGLKITENEGTAFALQTAGPARGSNDQGALTFCLPGANSCWT